MNCAVEAPVTGSGAAGHGSVTASFLRQVAGEAQQADDAVAGEAGAGAQAHFRRAGAHTGRAKHYKGSTGRAKHYKGLGRERARDRGVESPPLCRELNGIIGGFKRDLWGNYAGFFGIFRPPMHTAHAPSLGDPTNPGQLGAYCPRLCTNAAGCDMMISRLTQPNNNHSEEQR